MATTGTLMTAKNIYGLVNPPPDPSGNDPLAHQTINSGATNWGSHIDLSNAAVRVTTNQTIAGDKTFTGTVIVPTPLESDNTTKIATTAFVKTCTYNLVDGAPNSLNTLNELAAAINDDNNFHTTMTTALATKHASITSGARLNANLIGDNGNVSNTEYGYLNGVTSAIQTQIDSKQATITNGSITLQQVNALESILNSKAPLNGPVFVGSPIAPTATAGTNTTQLATTAFVKTAVDNLVDSAPGALDTLNELAAAIGDDANYAATVTTALAAKHPSITTSARLNANLIGDNGDVSNTEYGYLNGVTSAIQTQIDSKQATITDGDLTIARTSGLQAALDLKAPIAGPTFTGTPAAPTATAGTNTTQLATTAFVKTAVDNLVDGAPGALDTLNKLAAAIGDDANYAATVTTALSGKHPSITTSARLDANLIGDNGDVSNTEYGYLNGVTSAIQTQIDSKQASITDGDLTIARTSGLQAALDSKQVTITSSVDVSMNNLWVQGDISCNGGIEFKGHILPLAHETYDIGAADRKIRHLFLSDNSLWIGDNHKIDITGGKMKFKKRKTDIVPASILAAGGDAVGALAFTPGVGQLQDMQLHHWEEYARTLDVGGKGVGNALLQDIFVGNTVGDWEEDDALDDDIIISKVTGLQEALNGKQATIADGDLTIAKTAGLQTALDNAGGVKKPTMTIPELSSGNLLLNFTEPIKDLATYDKDDFVLTNEGTVFEPDSVVVENNKVRFKFSPTTHTVSTVAGMANAGAIVDGIGPNARFSTMFDMFAVGTDLYFDDSKRIRKMVLSTAEVTTLAGGAVGWPTDGIGSAVIFGGIHGVVSDGNNVYIADGTASVIRKLVIATGEVTTIAGTIGSSQYITGLVNGTGSSVKFNQPRGLAINSTGTNLYIGDYVNRVIRKMVLSTAEVTTLAGSGTQGSVDGTGTSAQFSGPWGIAIDSTDTNLYVADYSDSGGKIRKIVIATGVVTTLATLNVEVTKIVINSTDRYLYVTTRNNDIIVRIKVSDGTFITYGGQLDTAQSTDGTIDESRFNRPQSIAIDANDNIYVNEKTGRTIRKLTGSGGGPTITDVQNLTVTYTKSATVNENLIGTSPSSVAVDSFNFIGTNRIQSTIDDGKLTIAKTNGLQEALNGKQATIADGDLTIAKTNGLQAALDSKQATITLSSDISMNNLWVDGDISCNSTLKVDTINENTDTSGVTIDSVLLKDNTVTAHTITAQNYAVGSVNFISASRQGNFRDLEVKNSGNSATILLTGDGGNISIDGTLSADTIGEQTSGSGVTIDSVLLKDQNVTAHTVSASNYAVGGTNFISASRQGNFRDLEVKNSGNSATILLTGDGGDISIDGTLSADTIGEKTSTSGVTIDGVLLKDNDISANDISSNDLYVDTINERTSASGVTIDGVLLKDNNLTCTDLTASGTTAVATQSAGDNTTKIASTAFVKTAIDNLIDGAPGTLDTLKELSTALDNNNSYATTITLQLAQKAPKADPTFTGTPAAPTANSGTNTTQLATTAFVQTAISGKQATLTAGSNITISGTTISATTGSTTLSSLTDVNLTNVASGHSLVWNGSSMVPSTITAKMASIEPLANDTYSLGSPTNVWKDVYIGPGSLYIDGQKVIESASSTIIMGADANQNLKIKGSGSGQVQIEADSNNISIQTIGTGDVVLGSTGTGVVRVTKNLVLSSGVELSNISDAVVKINDGLDVTGTVKIGNYTLPTAAGTSGQVLKYPSSGSTLEWGTVASGGGGGGGSTTKKGQVLEMMSGVCNGSSIEVESGTYTLPNITSIFDLNSNDPVDIGTSFSYKPPAGTKEVIYTLKIHIQGRASHVIPFFALFIDNTEVSEFRHAENGYYKSEMAILTWTFTIGDVTSDDITTGRLASWNTNKTIAIKAAEAAGNAGYLFGARYLGNDSNSSDPWPYSYDLFPDNGFIPPILEITSIGEETTTSGGGGSSIDSTTDVSMNDLEVFGDISCNAIKLGGHIIPDTNAAYDLGNAEYKIRHLFLSDNSLWIGDDHKIDISGGKMKFKKRKKTAVPAAITSASGSDSGALTHAGLSNLSDMKLHHWEAYAHTLSGLENANIQDIFSPNTAGDWEEDEELGGSSSTTTKQGQLLETLTGICDGRTVVVESGSYTFPNVTTKQEISSQTTYEDLTGSNISYKPPSGTKQIIYKMLCQIARGDGGSGNYAGMAYRLYIDGVQCGQTKHCNNINYQDGYIEFEYVIDIGTNDMTNGKISSWTTNKTIKLMCIERDSSADAALHISSYNSEYGESNSEVMKPHLEIVAIGEGTVGAVSNAVTTSGDQTIAGTKTFSNAIISASYTTTQRDALTGVAGMVIFNTTVNKHQGYNGSSWNDFY